jgi:hypothetical protein
MIRFLGQRRDFNDRDPAAQILALRGIAKDLSSPPRGQLGDAVASYLDLVEATVQPGDGQGKLGSSWTALCQCRQTPSRLR